MVQSIADAVTVAGATIPRAALKGIQVASAQSGVSFQYLLAKAAQESGLDPAFARKFLNFVISEVIRHHEQFQN